MAEKRSYDGSASCGGCDARWTAKTWCHCSRCHRTFSGLGLFDAHRRGECLDPATIMTTPKDGSKPEHAMFLTDGVWRGVEEPADVGAALRAWRKANAA